MRAVVCTETGTFDGTSVQEVPAPEPGPGQVRVAVEAAGVGFADALMVQGRYQVQMRPPFTPGSEVAGVVDALGAGVERFSLGDHVVAMVPLGGFAEVVVAAADHVAHVPPGLALTRAAGITQSYCTGLFALRDRAALQPGETLLVLGAGGGVGLAAVDLGLAMGATVVAAASSEGRLEAARTRGAQLDVNYSAYRLKDRVREIVGSTDVVLDPVGGRLSEPALRTLGEGGRFLVVGFASGNIPDLPANQVLLRNRSVVGVDWGGVALRDPVWNLGLLEEVLEMVDTGSLQPPPPTVARFDDVPTVLDDLVTRRVVGKVVVTP